jgi:hypothetical protein
VSAFIVTLHAPAPPHAPPQPVKTESGDAVAVKFTDVPMEKTSAQSLPQLIPRGELEMDPLPEPSIAALSVNVFKANDALTAVSEIIVSAHAPVPPHAPLQPRKTEFAEGAAARVIELPIFAVVEQLAPQFIAPEPPDTVPDPAPLLLTARL